MTRVDRDVLDLGARRGASKTAFVRGAWERGIEAWERGIDTRLERLDIPRSNALFANALWAIGNLLLAAWLIFAHGCHADADTELCTFISESASAGAGR